MADDRRPSGDDVGEDALERALEEKDLLLYYQPIQDLNGTIVSAEALVRQRRESGEIREASIITETAEEKTAPGDLFRLDSQLVKMACRDAASWQRGHPQVHLNFNLSSREFTEGNVLDRITALIGDCKIDPRRVKLEITEMSYIEKPEDAVDVLTEVKRMGFELWLDDFGTHFSSLTHLQHFPLDGIKIAGTFVSGLPDDRRCRALVKALIPLAHDLDLRIVAEGVEKKSQLEILRGHGCDYIQGFLFSRPMPLEDFQKLLDSKAGSSTPQEHKDRDAGRDRASRSS